MLEQVVCDWIPTLRYPNGLAWNAAQEQGYPLYPGNEFRDSPDRLVFVTATQGPGYTTEEGATDAGAVQLRLRGPADNPTEASQMMAQLDQLILAAPFPVQIDGVWINHVGRQGSTPAPLPYDPKDKRFEFTCTYVIVHGGL